VKLMDNNSSSTLSQSQSLSSHSAHHIGKFTTPGNRVRQKSAPSSMATPTNSLWSRNKEDRTKIVYDILIAHRDVICSEKSLEDLIFKSNSMVNIFQQENSKTQSRPSTASTVNSDGVPTTSCLSCETSHSSVRSTHQHPHSRNKGRRQECNSDVEEDEVGGFNANTIQNVTLLMLQTKLLMMKTVLTGSGMPQKQNFGMKTPKENMVSSLNGFEINHASTFIQR